MILTVDKSNGSPYAFLTSDDLDASMGYGVVPNLTYGNYDFIAVHNSKISPKMSIVFDALNCTLHGDILAGRIFTRLFSTVVSCVPLTMRKVQIQ